MRCRGDSSHDRGERNSRRQYAWHLHGAGSARSSVAGGTLSFGPMALRDIFKFRDPPETETSKPFLEHLEDLRWTVVKMALTLGVAMIVCFSFRALLVRIIQAPLNHLGSQVGTLKALGITDSIVISFHLAFYAGIVLSFPL